MLQVFPAFAVSFPTLRVFLERSPGSPPPRSLDYLVKGLERHTAMLTWAIVVSRPGIESRPPTPHGARLVLRHSENGEESQ
jgi:hypothetical protein